MPEFSLNPPEHSPGRIIAQTFSRMRLGLTREFARAGFSITPEHWAVLSVLFERDGLRQQELADRTGKDKTAMTRILSLLEKDGLVRRVVPPKDRRSYLVHISPKGREAREELAPIVKRFLDTAFSGLSQEEFELFLRVNRTIADNITPLLAD